MSGGMAAMRRMVAGAVPYRWGLRKQSTFAAAAVVTLAAVVGGTVLLLVLHSALVSKIK